MNAKTAEDLSALEDEVTSYLAQTGSFALLTVSIPCIQ